MRFLKHTMLLLLAGLILSGCAMARTSVPATPQPTRAVAVTVAVRPTRSGAATPRRTATPEPARARDGLATIGGSKLPPEARDTLKLIEQGGPFPFDQDGAIFQNREGLLPRQARGYYHEYTVITPGEGDRGARRIVTGQRGELYYTDDHYDSFKRVEQ